MKYNRLLCETTHNYKPKQNIIRAVRYDGSFEMAKAIEECCDRSYIEWDEGGQFCGLRAFPENHASSYVDDNDYLVENDDGYVLVSREEFEDKFERAFTH